MTRVPTRRNATPEKLKTSSTKTSASRRNFLRTNAGLLAAGAMGQGLNVQAAGNGFSDKQPGMRTEQMLWDHQAMTWKFDELLAPPEETEWRVLDVHDTGYITDQWRGRRSDSMKRVIPEAAPDSRAAYSHTVQYNEVVYPVGADSSIIPADFSTFNRVVLRYHHWVEDYSYLRGKWIGLQLGRGWVGADYARPANDIYGYDGCSSTTMHPEADNGNGIRMLVSHVGQDNPYGQTIGRSDQLVPQGRWFTVDVVIERDVGYRLYRDGELQVETNRHNPMRNWNACRAVWYRNRLMHGGTPERLRAVRAYREWFGGFFIAVA